LSHHGGQLIVDNWQQDGFVCPACEELVAPYVGRIYLQPDHVDHAGHPWRTAYWEIGRRMPDRFQVTDEYNSHRPMLWMALEHTKGHVTELGCGYGSTSLLSMYCAMHTRTFSSFDTDPFWSNKFRGVTELVSFYRDPIAPAPVYNISVLFIDSAPGEERASLVEEYRNKALILIVHDTEPGAEAVYHIQDVLSSFPYRCDLLVPGLPQTTAVSMVYDFKDWKGVTIGKYQFV
jgi:hypothetical protein